jgi:hypothetical protein
MCTPDYKTQMKIAPEVGYGQHEIQLVVAAHQLWLPGTSNSAAAWLGTCIISRTLYISLAGSAVCRMLSPLNLHVIYVIKLVCSKLLSVYTQDQILIQ